MSKKDGQEDFWEHLTPEDLPGDLREIARARGMDEARYLVEQWGGVLLYIPAVSTIQKRWRDERILAEWNGRNDGALARRYKVSRRYIYTLLRQGREGNRPVDRFQHGLFSSAASVNPDPAVEERE